MGAVGEVAVLVLNRLGRVRLGFILASLEAGFFLGCLVLPAQGFAIYSLWIIKLGLPAINGHRKPEYDRRGFLLP